jgi:peptidoglycan/LPS O-acetylase OafA/YrhL
VTPAGESVRAEVGNIAALEGLRGIAVLWVISFHYNVLREQAFADPWIAALHASPPLHAMVGNGYLGVDLFFLITGFLLMLPWWRHAAEHRAPPDTRDFYRRRVRRIVPAYYVQLAFLFIVFVPLLLGRDYIRMNLWTFAYNVAAHATFLHYMTPLSSASLNVNGALWTLALEAQYYLLLPFLAPIFVRAPWRTAAAMAAIALAWTWMARHGLQGAIALAAQPGSPQEDRLRGFIASQLPGYLAHFAAGILAGRAWLAWRDHPPGRAASIAWLALGLAGFVAVGWIVTETTGYFTALTRMLALVAALTLVVLGLVSRGSRYAKPLLANAPLAFVGRVSYSAYLYHLPLLLLWNKYAPANLGWMSLPAYLAIVLTLAWASYRLVELPWMRGGKLGGGAGARAHADRERGDDGERLQQGHAPEDVGVAPRVHERPEGERRQREARVDAGIDEPVDAPEGPAAEGAGGGAPH